MNSARGSIVSRVVPCFALCIAATLYMPKARAQAKNHPVRVRKSAGYSKAPDLRTQPALYLVGYAHLDTQWRWEYPQVISEYLPDTMQKNFALFEEYPHYVFNWTGANRYMMMKEYFPTDYAKVKHYVATGQWFPAGSSMEENDVNSPSPESIIRQVLYGNEFFRREFGKASEGYMLPDCFGFPSDLPSILAAAGIKGFSTQKLTWGSSANVGGPDSIEKTPEGTPFNVGIWIGPDGHGVIAALNPGSYDGPIHYNLRLTQAPAGVKDFINWPARVNLDGRVSTAYADYHYYGMGDIGGAPDEESVKMVEQMTSQPAPAAANPVPKGEKAPLEPILGEKPLRIISSDADQMFKDILAQNLAQNLPKYRGDLELTNHSAGSLTSEAVHKRWNRENENLARAAEEASVGAAWLGGRHYPLERLNHAWRLVLGSQFHDIMAGTATPKAYEYSWNDDVIAMNQFAGVLTSAVDSIASELNTEGKGTAIVVYNPLSVAREDVVEAHIALPSGAAEYIRATGPDRGAIPAQVDRLSTDTGAKTVRVLFLAKVPPVGFAIYHLSFSNVPPPSSSSPELKTSIGGGIADGPTFHGSWKTYSIENARYSIEVDSSGDVTQIYDKMMGVPLLSAPMRLAFQTEKPSQWPAWNMDWDDQSKPPRGYVSGPAKISIVERGPVRVALRIEREAEGSKFVETIRLAAGDAGNRIEFANAIDWKTREAALKAVFPLNASNTYATYNWGAGTIQRPVDNEKTFEMASNRWFDLTDKSGSFGVTILSGAKTGSDRPNDHTLRLTLLYTPGISPGGEPYRDQATQDWGHHEFIYGLASHANDWSQGDTPWQAYRLDDPLIAFETSNHRGALGKSFSLLRVNNNDVRVMALKRSENGEGYVVRMVEMTGKPERNVHVAFAAPVISAQRIDGQERPLGPAAIADGALSLFPTI